MEKLQKGTIITMRKRYKSAPQQIQRLVLISYIILIPVIISQIYAIVNILSSIQQQLSTGDIFTSMLEPQAKSSYNAFIIGFSTSIAASFGTMILIGATRLAVPYRHKLLKVILYGFPMQVLIIVSNIIGIYLSKSVLDAATIGSIASISYSLPVFVLSLDKTVRAWSVEFIPPPPELPKRE